MVSPPPCPYLTDPGRPLAWRAAFTAGVSTLSARAPCWIICASDPAVQVELKIRRWSGPTAWRTIDDAVLSVTLRNTGPSSWAGLMTPTRRPLKLRRAEERLAG